MLVVVVCTGNVVRSPALAQLMRMRLPDIEFDSAAVGKNAREGERMRPRMRKLLTDAGYGTYAELHRSRRLQDLAVRPDLLVACAPVHVQRITEIDYDAHVWLADPVISDPVYGGEEAYLRTWSEIRRAADWLARELSWGGE